MRILACGLLLAPGNTVISERLAALSAIVRGAGVNLLLFFTEEPTDNFKLCENGPAYVKYLSCHAAGPPADDSY